jgi:isopentenyl diphosphate isomerase/L-lactate dehydrogenase-like FMN-dependent dehydrogenase
MPDTNHFPPGAASRRRALRHLTAFLAGSPLMVLVDENGEPVADPSSGQQRGTPQTGRQGGPGQPGPGGGRGADRPGTIRPPTYRDEILRVVNLHEFEEAARKSLSIAAYDYVAAGAGDELTLRANREAFGRYWVRRKVMVDVSRVDTTLELFGQKFDHPILLGPGGAKNIMIANGERLCAAAARQTKSIMVGGQVPVLTEMGQSGEAPVWWGATLGEATQAQAVEFAKRSEGAGASALCITVDYPYTGARDRPSRDQWDPAWARTRVFGTPEFRVGFQAGMLDPYTPSLTWEWMKWVRSQTKLPIVIKGILTAEDARLAVENGAQAVIVSNHGARTLDGMAGTLDALPEVVEAVNGRIPVLVDGGIRRGGDVIKALALGAKAILIGRPYLWGLAAFGQEGVQRVIELLHGELRIALGLSGAGSLNALDRSFIRPAWKAYKPAVVNSER